MWSTTKPRYDLESMGRCTRASQCRCDASANQTHFEKNAHSSMHVFLAMQVLSQSVYNLIQYFVDGNEELKETFSSLSLIVVSNKLN